MGLVVMDQVLIKVCGYKYSNGLICITDSDIEWIL